MTVNGNGYHELLLRSLVDGHIETRRELRAFNERLTSLESGRGRPSSILSGELTRHLPSMIELALTAWRWLLWLAPRLMSMVGTGGAIWQLLKHLF